MASQSGHMIKEIAKGAVSLRYDKLCMSSYELQRKANRVWTLEEKLDGLDYDYQKHIAPFQDQKSITRRRSPDFIFRRPFVAELTDGVVVGPRAAIMTTEGKIVADSLKRPAKHHRLHGHIADTVFSKSYIQHRVGDFGKERNVDTAAVIHRKYSSDSFYHWLIDRISTLRGIEHYQAKTGNAVTIILSQHAPDWIHSLLDHAGFSENQVMYYNGGPIHVQNLVVPSWPEITPKALTWLRETIIGSVQPPDKKTPSRLYVSRQHTDRRKVVNYDEIRPVLTDYGIEVVHLEETTFEEEVKMMNAAETVIGPHGAGLTGMIWAGDLSVLEIFNGNIIPPFYLMADILEFEYSAILGKAHENGKGGRHNNIYLDPNNLEKRLSEVL